MFRSQWMEIWLFDILEFDDLLYSVAIYVFYITRNANAYQLL